MIYNWPFFFSTYLDCPPTLPTAFFQMVSKGHQPINKIAFSISRKINTLENFSARRIFGYHCWERKWRWFGTFQMGHVRHICCKILSSLTARVMISFFLYIKGLCVIKWSLCTNHKNAPNLGGNLYFSLISLLCFYLYHENTYVESF